MHAPIHPTGASTGASADPARPAKRTAPPRLCIIYNPTAGWRRQRRFRRTLAALRAHGGEVQVLETAHAGHAEEMARDLPDCDRVVVAGGDGTLNEVLNGLAGRPVPLGLIPLGTANVTAHELGLSPEPEKVARTLLDGPATPVHLGNANGRRFAQMAGIGFDAQVVAAVSPRLKRWLGKGAYVLAFMSLMPRFRTRNYKLRIDGAEDGAASVIVQKGRYYGGRFVLAPEARPWRPLFQVVLFRRAGLPAIAGYGLALVLGRLHRHRDVDIVPAQTVEVTGAAGEPVQLDGDDAGRLPVVIDLMEDAALFVVPPGSQLPASVMPSTRTVGASVP